MYIEKYPTAFIVASGENVGLPPSNQGSSEVGHLNMGAGRVVYQSLVRISREIETGSFYKNAALIAAMTRIKGTSRKLHLWGLVQDQGVHAHNEHLIALFALAREIGLAREQVLVHVFSDGRDTPPQSTAKYVAPIEDAMKKHGIGLFASIVGRYYAMDRDNRWDRVRLAYELLTEGKGEKCATIQEAIQSAYAAGENDEFIKPRVLPDFAPVSDGDSVIFFNYRLDRTRELTKAFVQDGFKEFPTKAISDLAYVCFTEYYEGVAKSSRAAVSVAFGALDFTNLFGEFVAKKGLKQLRIAETEKFAHITFFFNGQSDVVFENEDRELIPSPQVATYDLKPEMSAYEVRDKVLERLDKDIYDVVILNFANPDMVGHTGDYDATLKACAVVDECVGSVIEKILSLDGVALLTSDHGNAEQMRDYLTNEPMTAHTSNIVWCSLISKREELQRTRIRLRPSGGRLADLTPTLLEIMDCEKPAEMDGQSLIERL
jgi:2,3-bisphosphoglycerate-independent phosphoglycerate mutase